jgi:hypothetical protein
MNWDAIPKGAPTRTFSVGDVIEDYKAIYKVMEPCVVQGMIHKYKCQVLQRKQPVPTVANHEFSDVEWVIILKQNEHLIRTNG